MGWNGSSADERDMKSAPRNPKSEGNPKLEARSSKTRAAGSIIRKSSFGFLPGSEIRISSFVTAGLLCLAFTAVAADVPANLVVEGVPAITPELRADVGRYLEFRSASFNSWHPQRREMLISTRFGNTSQLHLVKQPEGARRQLTFFPEPVAHGSFQRRRGEFIVFSQDR